MANQLTERGIHVIKQWERFRAAPYADGWKSNGDPILSIGFGHSNYLTHCPFDKDSRWTEEQAHDVLVNHDLPYFYNLLLPHLKAKVSDEVYSIFGSLSMNKGVGKPGNEKGLINSKAWALLHDGGEYHQERFCEEILTYAIYAPNKSTREIEVKRGLKWRRIAEAGLFMQDRSANYL